MTENEARQHAATFLLGASLGLGMLIEGLEGHIEPETLTDAQRGRLHEIHANVCEAAAALAQLGAEIDPPRR